MTIEFKDEDRKRALKSIKRYFDERLEMEVGDLQAMMLFDFFLEELAPTVHNEAIADAQAYLQERMGDLEATCYEAEFGYWEEDDG
ncbi:MAG: DUF2164 family protein [Candidatus Eisenbacteria bacterium]|nr:DUF2164 family protein [Candidatus Eisenbacteria bacterium]